MFERDSECTNSRGGNNELYVLPFVKYSFTEVQVENNYLTAFPLSTAYKIDSPTTTFTESVTDEKGGTTFAQNVAFQLNKITDTDDYREFVDYDWRLIVRDNNGNYRIVGLWTGLKGNYTKETGGNSQDYNGFRVTFETQEERTAPFLTDLSFFNIV